MVEKPYEYSILKGNFNKVHKIRVGNYRILFDINENKNPRIIRIIDIGLRKNIYK